jgi:hypothetical protein
MDVTEPSLDSRKFSLVYRVFNNRKSNNTWTTSPETCRFFCKQPQST